MASAVRAASGGGRSGAASSVGMMDGAFLVSRTELLAWANNLLQTHLTQVEQCANGAVYCQIIDSCHPGTVAMHKVNWMAKTDHEFIPNYKVLQVAFDKNFIKRNIDVDKLIRGKYQDNLEFLQWVKCHWERETDAAHGYDPTSAREGKRLPAWAQKAAAPPGNATPAAPGTPSSSRHVRKEAPPISASPRPAAPRSGTPRRERTPQKENIPPRRGPMAGFEKAGVPTKPQNKASKRPSLASQSTALGTESFMASVIESDEHEELRHEVASQAEELTECRYVADGLTLERDYYFRKLRNVEAFCQTLHARMNPDLSPEQVVEDLLGILYAEDGCEEGTQAVSTLEVRIS